MCDIIMTPFWMVRPNRAMNPTAEDTLNVIPLTFRASRPPNRASGRREMSRAACLKYPNAQKSIRNISASTKGMMIASLE